MEFLTDEQAESYGTFESEPTRPELERFFVLDDEDRRLIGKRRGDHSRLGFALQVCTVRYIGLFLQDPLLVPWPVVVYLAEQLDIAEPSSVKWYTEREKTAYEHAWEIEQAFGYHSYDDPGWGRKFRTFLYGRAWTHAEGPVALFNHATAWLRRNRVLLPGVHVLARQVSAARTGAEDRLHSTVARATRRADPALPPALVGLLARTGTRCIACTHHPHCTSHTHHPNILSDDEGDDHADLPAMPGAAGRCSVRGHPGGQDGYGPGLFLPAQALQLGRGRAGCGRRGSAAGTGVRRIGPRHRHHVCRCGRGRHAPAEEGKTMMSTTRSQAKAGRCNGWGQG